MEQNTEGKKAPGTIPVSPGRYCDIVMKGGVTSGIVYPLAVCELAGSFRFVNIGGTSAGAIAAAATAAAEYRRSHGDVRGFTEEVMNLPGTLGERLPDGSTKLLSLFQPNPSTKKIYDALIRLMRGSMTGMAVTAVRAVFSIVPGTAWLCLLAFGVTLLLMWAGARLLVLPLALPLLLVLTLFAAVILVFVGLACARKIIRVLVANKFGLCTGYIRGRDPATEPPLTEWLADFLDRTAGKTDPASPLTFGDLWGVEGKGKDGGEKINLQMMTTNLTQGRPYQLPFEEKDLYWDPEEFRDLFPERVINWMKAHSDPYADGKRYGLPPGEDMPVIVAVRMSLSFPVLISAVPIWSADFSRLSNKALIREEKPAVLERSWFSDGGICSNFPVHFFDSPLPRWPTFAINLRPFHPDFHESDDESRNVWMPATNGQGILEQWVRFDAGDPVSSFTGFLMRIVNTMQNWIDNTQLKIPGYRDRVAHVYLTDREGGLNLEMAEGAIDRLSKRGQCAGELLRDRFTDAIPGCPLDWDNHRWVRYRSTMTLLDTYLHGIAKSYKSAALKTERTYADLVTRGPRERPKSYEWKPGQKPFAAQIGKKLESFIKAWDAFHQDFQKGTPKPIPELRTRPKI
jgi:predicted acylesterase/phospholipase RssA